MRTSSRIRKEFEAAVLPLLSDLYAIAIRYTREPSDAQDLVQETVLRAYAAWGSFVPGSNCRAWLIRILTNSFINHYRRGRSYRSFTRRSEDEQVCALYGNEIRPENRDPEQRLTGGTFGDEVTRALDSLGEDYRVVVMLADVEGMKYKEIAELLGCPIGTVMSRLFRARRQLEEKLAPFASADYGIGRAA
jgi:RNA polymerase sigma-70 factor (ECF subfamily)